jgi:hypothetical protein
MHEVLGNSYAGGRAWSKDNFRSNATMNFWVFKLGLT